MIHSTSGHKHFALCIGLVLATAQAQAGDIYVSTQGSDGNAGTAAQPFRTISYAYSRASAGTTIHVAPGVYTDYSSGWGIHLGKSGTAAKPIVLRSDVRGGAVIDGRNAADRNQGFYIDGSYNTVDGFEVRYCPSGGVSIWANNARLLNNYIHHNGNQPSSSTNGKDGVYSNAGTSGNVYSGNLVRDNGRTGSNLDHGLYLCGQNETVINNVLLHNAACGLQVAGYNTVKNLKVYNNVMAWNGTDGIILWLSLSGIDIRNNILYQNGHYGVGSYDASGSGVVLDRNLSYGNGYGHYDFKAGGSTYSYSLGTTITSDPHFAGAGVSAFDPHLANGSSAIQAGVNLFAAFNVDMAGSVRPSSGAWDLGAYVCGVPVNSAPAISGIGAQSVAGGEVTSPLWFTIADDHTPAGQLKISARSSNQNVVPDANIFLGGSGSSRTVTVGAVHGASGSATITITVNDGALASSRSFDLAVNASSSSVPILPATSGAFSGPFYRTNSAILQPASTSLPASGQAIYTFSISAPGNYMIWALVNAPSTDNNSFLVNIDGQPSEPSMIWDIPVNPGFLTQPVSWRGNGTVSPASPSGVTAQYSPKVFWLSAGIHQLIIRGREGNCQLRRIQIAPTSLSAT